MLADPGPSVAVRNENTSADQIPESTFDLSLPPSLPAKWRSFSDLTRAQVYECLAYYEDHRAEIDTLIARQMSPEL